MTASNLDGLGDSIPASDVSRLNWTNSAIAGGGTFTGAWELNSNPHVMVSCKVDGNCTLYFDFSNDGVNADTFPVNGFLVSSGIHEFHKALKGPRYFRVRLVCDAGENPTYTRLYAYFGTFIDSNTPLNQSIGVDADAVVTRPTDYHHEVARGLRAGSTTWNKWGYNELITSTEETVWSVGDSFTQLTDAEIQTIAFPNAADRTGGTGMTGVIIYGVGDGWVPQTEVVLASGATVDTTLTWLGINRMEGYSFGSGRKNVGLITATSKISATIQAQIPIGKGSTQHAFYFCPAGYSAEMSWITINGVKVSGGGTPMITTIIESISSVSGGTSTILTDYLDTSVSDFHPYDLLEPLTIGEKSLIEFKSFTDTGTTGVNIRFSLIETKNL